VLWIALWIALGNALWIAPQASNETAPCKLPDIPLPKPIFGANCVVPIIWKTTNVTLTDGVRDRCLH
jgi:hypothetical protein